MIRFWRARNDDVKEWTKDASETGMGYVAGLHDVGDQIDDEDLHLVTSEKVCNLEYNVFSLNNY